MSGEPAPTAEITRTPRQRVEASLNERGKILSEIGNIEGRNREIVFTEGGWRFQMRPEDSARRAQLEASLQKGIADFRQNIVSKSPEAEAWVEIEKEDCRRVLENQSYRAEHASTPTEQSHARVAIQVAKNSLANAERNLVEVRKLNAGVPTNSSKTP